MTASSLLSRYTAASSLDSNPTRRLGSVGKGNPCSASDRAVGPIFAAQPQVRASPVRVFFLPKRFIFSFSNAVCIAVQHMGTNMSIYDVNIEIY